MARANLHVNINLAGISGGVQRTLKRITYLVSIGANATNQIDEASLVLPDIDIVHQYDTSNPWTPEDARNAWQTWIFTNGFRDLAEIVASTLEELHSILSVWSVLDPSSEGVVVGAEKWNENVVHRASQFHRKTLPQKLQFLEDKYSFVLPSDYIEEIASLNAVRNCFVHRGGIVSAMDLDASGALTLRWRSLTTVVIDGDDVTEIRLPHYAERQVALGVRVDRKSKQFSLGETISIDVRTFSELCWSLFQFSHTCGVSLERYGKSRGFTFAERGAPET